MWKEKQIQPMKNVDKLDYTCLSRLNHAYTILTHGLSLWIFTSKHNLCYRTCVV